LVFHRKMALLHEYDLSTTQHAPECASVRVAPFGKQ
jgi:hypothetical protein